jgi:hypothetical protein
MGVRLLRLISGFILFANVLTLARLWFMWRSRSLRSGRVVYSNS